MPNGDIVTTKTELSSERIMLAALFAAISARCVACGLSAGGKGSMERASLLLTLSALASLSRRQGPTADVENKP